jgi:plastocyanin
MFLIAFSKEIKYNQLFTINIQKQNPKMNKNYKLKRLSNVPHKAKRLFLLGCFTALSILASYNSTLAQCTQPPGIVSQSPDRLVCTGASLYLQVIGKLTAANQPTIGSAQWYKDGQPISGAQMTALSGTATTTSAGTYYCRVGGRSFFGCQNVFVDSAPIIVTSGDIAVTDESQSSPTFCAGSGSSLFVTVSGIVLQYRWRFNGNTILNATSSTYTPTGSGEYKVDISSNCGTITKTFNVSLLNDIRNTTQNTCHTTLQGALDAANENDIIKILKSVNEDININKSVTIEALGYILSIPATLSIQAGKTLIWPASVINVNSNATITNNGTFKNNGTINYTGGTFTNTGTYTGSGTFNGNFVNNGTISPSN